MQIERNRRLALALQIENPETRDKLGNASVLFSDFMKDEARKDPNLAKMVHDALTDLVLKAKEVRKTVLFAGACIYLIDLNFWQKRYEVDNLNFKMYFSLFNFTFLLSPAFQSKQKSRSHSFAPMNREKRQFVHEYCEHFGCQSQSYDDEPKKNIVATAVKGMVRMRVKTTSNDFQSPVRTSVHPDPANLNLA